MTKTNEFNNFCDEMLGLSLLTEKARYINETLFYSSANCSNDTEKLIEFDSIRILADIALDYIVEIDDNVSKLNTEYSKLLNIVKDQKQ